MDDNLTPEVDVVLAIGTAPSVPRGKPAVDRRGTIDVTGPITLRGVSFESDASLAQPHGSHAVRARFIARKGKPGWRVVIELAPAT